MSVVRPDSGHAAAKPAVSVVRPDSGHTAAKPAVSVVTVDTAAKPAVSVVRPDSGHAAAKPAVSVVRPDSGHTAAKPAVSVVRPDSGHTAAKPAVSVVRPDSGHAAAKPAVSVVRPGSGHAAAKPAVSVVRPDSGHAAAKPAVSVVRPDSGHAAAKPAVSVVRTGSGHAANTHHYVMPTFTSLKPTCVKMPASYQPRPGSALSPGACPTHAVIAPSTIATSHKVTKQMWFEVDSPPEGQGKSSFGLTLSNVTPRDITNLPLGVVVASTTKPNATFQDSHVFSKPLYSPAYQSYYVESTPSPNDGDIENAVQHSRFKTPSVTPDSEAGRLLKTPPLCQCGRRCKRNYVQSPGANVGRSFFCCPLGRRSSGNRKSPTGCGFFQWEQAAMKRRHSSSPALSTGSTASRSVHVSPSSNLLPQPNFDTPGSKVKVGLNNRDGRFFR